VRLVVVDLQRAVNLGEEKPRIHVLARHGFRFEKDLSAWRKQSNDMLVLIVTFRLVQLRNTPFFNSYKLLFTGALERKTYS
jgi:hypothetical protein